MSDSPETLRLYASIFEKPRRDVPNGPLRPPFDIEKAAADALRFKADTLPGQQPETCKHEDGPCTWFGCVHVQYECKKCKATLTYSYETGEFLGTC